MNDRTRDNVTDALDRRAAAIDAATLSRLRQAREQALAQRPGWRRWLPRTARLPTLIPAGGLAAAFALLVALNLNPVTPDSDAERRHAPPASNVAWGEDLELLQDLEFYEWLDRQEHSDHHA